MSVTRPTHRLLSTLALAVVVAASHANIRSVGAQDDSGTAVSRTPPARYAESVSPLLTSREAILESARGFDPQPEAGGATILIELIHHVAADGSRLVVLHSVARADSDAGAADLSEQTQAFSSASQKVHLALAETISADGSTTPVRDNAAFIQTPQRSADRSIYSDTHELVVIFPKVKPGAMTRAILIFEEDEMRVPGEFTTSITWGGAWREARKRVVIDVPDDLGQRLRFSQLGVGTPEPVRSTPAAGRTRFTLERLNPPAVKWEVGAPPVDQAGPATWVTSLPDWEAFGDWYRPLLDGRANLSPALAAKVDAWTEGAEDQGAVVDILFRRAASDVRYTGLEFGLSALQPYDCNEVWENQYGDCKDKSNLLRAMLAHKGVTSHLALVNTDHAGRIERRSPDYRQFDHAILAVERGDGTLQFCDPTLEFGHPGLLAPSAGDRDALVIRRDSVEFVRTPPAPAGSLDYQFDLEVNNSRELSGWATVRGSGFFAATYRTFLSTLEPAGVNQALAQLITEFFPTAEVIDSELPAADAPPGDSYAVRVFFVAPGAVLHGHDERLSLTFPHADHIFPQLGDTKARSAPFFGPTEAKSVTAAIAVPEEFGSPQLPRPFGVDSSAVSAAASWAHDPQRDVFRAELRFEVKKPLLSAEEFQVAFGAVTSMRAWLGAPIVFDPAVPRDAQPQPPVAADLADFPLMPTGRGQLNLVDQRFPTNGNPDERRAALHKVLQFFPDDLETHFRARCSLAELDWALDHNDDAIRRIEELLASPASDAVGPEDIALAEYIMAFSYRDRGDMAKAAEILHDISDNAEVSDYRRSWAGYQRLMILRDLPEPDFADLAAEAEALLDAPSDARPFLVALYAEFLSRSGRSAEFARRLAEIAATDPADLPEIIRLVVSIARDLPADLAGPVVEVLRELPLDPGSAAALMRTAELETLDAHRAAADLSAGIQAELRAFLAANRPDDWDETAPDPAIDSSEQFVARLDELDRAGEPRAFLRHALEYLTRFAPDQFFGHFLWRAAAHSSWLESVGQPYFAAPAVPRFLDLCDRLPEDSAPFLEARFLRAEHHSRSGDHAAAAAVYRDLLARPQLDEAPRIVATAQLALAEEELGHLDAARDRHASLRDRAPESTLALDSLFRAILIDLELGHHDRALDLLDALKQVAPESLKLSRYHFQIEALCALDEPRAYWEASAEWWPRWRELVVGLTGAPEPPPTRTPAIGDLQVVGVNLNAARLRGDREEFFTQLDLLLRALRWEPSMLDQAASALTVLARPVSPESTGELLGLMLTIADNFHQPTPEQLRSLQLFAAVSYFDTGRPAEALALAVEFGANPHPVDSAAVAMARLWAAAAGRVPGADLEAPAAALERILASGDLELGGERAAIVVNLAELYNRQERPDLEEALLARELQHASIKADPNAHAQLELRHQELARAGAGGREFTAAACAWLDAHSPAWLTHCPPADVDDPRIDGDIERALRQPEGVFSEEEAIKLNALAARSADLGIELRSGALFTVFQALLGDARTHEQVRTMVAGIVEDERFSPDFRRTVIGAAFEEALAQCRTGDMRALVENPLLHRPDGAPPATITHFRRLAEIDYSSPDSLLSACSDIAKGGVSGLELGSILRCFVRLLEMGELEAGEEIYRSSADWQLDREVPVSRSKIRLGMLRTLKGARDVIPASKRVHEAIAPLLAVDGAEKPAFYDELRRASRRNTNMSAADRRALLLWEFREQNYNHLETHFWFDLGGALKGPESARLAYVIIETLMAEIDTDSTRSHIPMLAPTIVDTDEPDVRARLDEIFAPFRNLRDAPLTRDALQILQIRADLRSGREIDLEAAFKEITHPAASPEMRLATQLTLLYQQDDVGPLRAFLQAAAPDDLLDQSVLSLAIPALRRAGLDDEAELAVETAREQLPGMIASGWRHLTRGALHDVYQIATELGEPGLIPPELFAHLSGGAIKHERYLLSLQMRHHLLHQDWPQLERAAREANEQFPTYYYYYYFRGRALFEMGDQRAAAAPLNTFVQYCKDHVELRHAQQMLAQIED